MPFSLFPHLRELGLPAPGGVLQIGASYGQEMVEFVEAGIHSGLFIEPLPAPFENLASICRQVPRFVAFNGLCSDVAGRRHDFHVASNGGMSSSILKPARHLKVHDRIGFPTTIELVSTTVDAVMDFARDNGYRAVVDALDLLYMDCQGAESRIVAGAAKTLGQFKYIYSEVMRANLYEGQTPFLSYCRMLDEAGFTLNDVYFGWPDHSGNALFIRKDVAGVE